MSGFSLLLVGHFAVVLIGWSDQSLAHHEFRQAQTALSTYFIQTENNYHLAYPTPILGMPWSVPMEFPLYQWTVAKLVTWFNWPLIQTGRGVSLTCFYLTLPAWLLLLRSVGLSLERRLSVLMFALTCPVYLIYGRSLLIEAMALLAASWHLFGVVEIMLRPRWTMLVVAWLAGIVAALVKVTTWSVVLLPALTYAIWRLWHLCPQRLGRWAPARTFVAWTGSAVVPPLIAAGWWLHTADAIKAQNPAAQFLLSARLHTFNFGTFAQRVSVEFWHTLVQHWSVYIAPVGVLLFVLIAGLGFPSPFRRLIGLCLVGFLGSQLLFSNLYFLHSYYFFANAFFLVVALGLAAGHLLDFSRRFALFRYLAWCLLLLAPAAVFHREFLPRQRMILRGTDELSDALQQFGRPDDVIVVLGDDWSSIIPFSARRRALMVPSGAELQEEPWSASLRNLSEVSVPFLLVKGESRIMSRDLRKRIDQLGMYRQPLFSYQGLIDVYVHRDRLHEVLGRLRGASFPGIEIPPNLHAPGGDQKFDPRRDAAAFSMMAPYPERYHTPYDIPPWFEFQGVPVFIAHPKTELEFSVPSDVEKLTIRVGMIPEAYELHGSDGVEIVIEHLDSAGNYSELWRKTLNPRDIAEDRIPFTATLALPQPIGGRLLIQTLPGGDNNPAFDWIYFSQITLQ